MIKSSNNGPFQIPTAPSKGTSVTSGAANVYSAAYVQLTAGVAENDFITGVSVNIATTSKPLYCNVQLATGAGGSEVVVGQIQFCDFSTTGAAGSQIGCTVQLPIPIPVANGTRIAMKVADDVGSLAWNVSLQMAKQADLVDAGVQEKADITGTQTGTVTITDGLLVNRSSANSSAVVFTGAGSGDGLTCIGGNNGSGNGIFAQSNSSGGTGNGLKLLGGGSGGDGLNATGGGNSGHGISTTGVGTSRHGINAVGSPTTGNGITATGGATSGDGFKAIATTSGNGITATGAGTTKHGIAATGGATSSDGINAAGGGTGYGFRSTGGATGHGIGALGGATSGDGINSVAQLSGHGLTATGVGTTKHGINAAGGATTSDGINATGGGTGVGLRTTAGATGQGILIVGGATSGDGVKITTTSGHGINSAPAGTSMHGILATGGNGGTSDGFKCVAGTGGVPIRGNITGNITGTLDTVTTLSNLPAMPANWLTAAGIAASALNGKGDWITSASLPANFSSLQISSAGVAGDYAGTSGATNSTTTLQLDAFSSSVDDSYVGDLIIIPDTGTGYSYQTRTITGYVGGVGPGARTVTVDRPWNHGATPANATPFIIRFDSGPKLDTSLRTTDVNSANLDAAVSTRSPAAPFAGITSLANWLRLIGRKDADAATAAEMNAANAATTVGAFDPTTDSEQAIRDRGDAAWTGGTTVVNPVYAALAAGEASKGALVAYQHAVPGPYVFPALGFSLAGKTIELVVFDQSNADAEQFTISGSGIVISGAGNDIITATGLYTDTTTAGNYSFIVWNVTDHKVLFAGSFAVRPTAGP